MVMPNTWLPGPSIYPGDSGGVRPALPTDNYAYWGGALNAVATSCPSGGGNTNLGGNWTKMFPTQTLQVDANGLLLPNPPPPTFAMALWYVDLFITAASSPATGTPFQLSVGSQFGFSGSLTVHMNINAIGDTTNGTRVSGTLLALLDVSGSNQRLNPRINHQAGVTLSIGSASQLLYILNAPVPMPAIAKV